MKQSPSNNLNSPHYLLKWGIWLYILLLIFEGALRKWFLPMLSGPLAIIRDPLALLIILMALKNDVLKSNFILKATVVVTVIAFATTLMVGHANIPVAIFGARITLIHFPLIFIMGKILAKEDLVKIGKLFIYVSIPMTILMILQFYSPQSAWVNRGIGGDLEGAGFQGSMGYFRPPGTFSFITGLTQFYGIVTCFAIYFWFNLKHIKPFPLALATLGIVAAIPFSISRTLLFQSLGILVFMIIYVLFQKRYLTKIFLGFALFVTIFILLLNTELLATPLEAFVNRFEGASKFEGGVSGTIVDRYLGGMFGAFIDTDRLPFFGHGLGIGTNAGAQLLTGERSWLIDAEDEWYRLIGESGLLLGFLFILIRVCLSVYLGLKAFEALKKDRLLPWILLSFCFLLLPNGQWGQPTALGFGILITGLLLASLEPNKKN